MMVAMQAVALYVQAVVQESQVTGVPPKFDVRALISMVAQAQKESVTPPSPEEVKAREEAASGSVQK